MMLPSINSSKYGPSVSFHIPPKTSTPLSTIQFKIKNIEKKYLTINICNISFDRIINAINENDAYLKQYFDILKAHIDQPTYYKTRDALKKEIEHLKILSAPVLQTLHATIEYGKKIIANNTQPVDINKSTVDDFNTMYVHSLCIYDDNEHIIEVSSGNILRYNAAYNDMNDDMQKIVSNKLVNNFNISVRKK